MRLQRVRSRHNLSAAPGMLRGDMLRHGRVLRRVLLRNGTGVYRRRYLLHPAGRGVRAGWVRRKRFVPDGERLLWRGVLPVKLCVPGQRHLLHPAECAVRTRRVRRKLVVRGRCAVLQRAVLYRGPGVQFRHGGVLLPNVSADRSRQLQARRVRGAVQVSHRRPLLPGERAKRKHLLHAGRAVLWRLYDLSVLQPAPVLRADTLRHRMLQRRVLCERLPDVQRSGRFMSIGRIRSFPLLASAAKTAFFRQKKNGFLGIC